MKTRLLAGLVLALAHTAARAACDPSLPSTTPDERYIIDTTAGVVTDRVTGLTWQRCSLGQSGSDCSGGSAISFNWQAALQAAQDSSAAGYNDWRLPDLRELLSIVGYHCSSPAVNSTVFPGTQNGSYWSSSPLMVNDGYAWRVAFNSGVYFGGSKTGPIFVRLVRGGL